MNKILTATLVIVSLVFASRKSAHLSADIVYNILPTDLVLESDNSTQAITGGIIRMVDSAKDDGILVGSEILEITVYHTMTNSLGAGVISSTDQQFMGINGTFAGNELRGSGGVVDSDQEYVNWESNENLLTVGVFLDNTFVHASTSFTSPFTIATQAIPEPSSACLIGAIALTLIFGRRRTNKNSFRQLCNGNEDVSSNKLKPGSNGPGRQLIVRATSAMIITISFFCVTPATAQPLLNPENGHYYDLIFDQPRTWHEARIDAETHFHMGIQGHLATLLTEQENDFVYENLLGSNHMLEAWLGASDEEVENEWRWITGEVFWKDGVAQNGYFSNFGPGQPDDAFGGEHYLHFWAGDFNAWNDLGPAAKYQHYVIESSTIPEPSLAIGVAIFVLPLILPGRRRTHCGSE